jgi:hypothetical protein
MWQIMRLRNTNEEDVDDDLFSLACGPNLRVRKYSSCIVSGVRFNTVDHDKNKKTQNSGVMSQSTHNGQVTDFFGTLKEIIQLDYNERSVVLFKCDWFKLDGKRTELKDDGFFRSINVGSLWYKNDCYILATKARKVFYLQTQDLEKIGKLYRHLNTDIFTMLVKSMWYNIMVLHIKRMTAVKRSTCENQFLTAHMTTL